ncbi:MAG: hypothetical protein WC889_08570 [Myxococcota bacterium]|jgi:hypothetical protein
MKKYTVAALAAILIALAAAPASAWFYEGARPAGMGSAYSAIATGNEAIYYNPAGMSSQVNRYNLDVGYEYNPTSGQNVWNASILDGSTNPPLGAGVAFTYFLGNTVHPRKWQRGYRIDLALSYPLGTKKVLWGIDIKYVNEDIGSKESAINAVTFDTGLLYVISKNFRMSSVGRNLTGTGRQELPYQSIVGMSAGKDGSFSFNFDFTVSYVHLDDIDFTYNGGLEVFLGKSVGLRTGYLYEGINYQQYASAGLNFVVENFGMDIAFKQSTTHGSDHSLFLVLKFFLSQ